ncbi:MAG: hypothetical protein LBK94_05980 [Prevotellaceae bacterium]|jgi:hypothetical protein|nr:hypothetical protein [Prevotellaceae bacterium]
MSRLIKIDPNNFNKHTEEGEQLLEKSVVEVGVIESIATDANGDIITGNARKKVFDKLGLKPKFIKLKEDEYPVIETDLDGEKRVKAAILANTVAQKNINLDVELIKEVAVNQLDIDIVELGVETIPDVDYSGQNKEINASDFDDAQFVLKLSFDSYTYISVLERLKNVSENSNEVNFKKLLEFWEQNHE